MEYILGVDGGTTKTVALVALPDGTIVGAGRAGGSNIYCQHLQVAFGNVERAVLAALNPVGARPADLATAAYSMSGADWPEDFDFIRNEVLSRGLGRRIVVVNDAVGGLRAGSPDGSGVAVICGTGAAVAARTQDGRVWHTGFWQEAGGADQLGTKMLRAVYRAELEIDPPTGLTERVLRFFGLTRVEDVLHLLTAHVGTSTNVGALARVLLDEAYRGDPTARRIAEEHGSALGDYAVAAARRVGIEGEKFPLILAGGVFRHACGILMDSLVERVRATSSGAWAVRSRYEPVVGALLLSLEEVGVKIDEPLLGRIAVTLPEHDLFVT
ncbi:MAG: hypothetical protein M3R24_37910 [Chloroflexota bacterium]|nr:hypothetical protein [Chloroflexota bacterium]